MQTALRRTFTSLAVYNFRLYFIGQGLSLCGTWVQTVSLSLLVLQLTHSGTQLGLVVAAQYLPVLLFGAYGGVIADRFNKRHVLYLTQSLQGILALTLGLLVVTGAVQVWMVYVVAIGLGLAALIDAPSRQTFVIEMVGSDRLKNAITLNSTMVNGARIIGPSIAAVLIATVGIGFCFLVNAASYLAVLGALFSMRASELFPTPLTKREPGQIKAGLRYAWQTPALKSTLVMMLVIGTFAYEFPVILPLFATRTLHGNATTYSLMTVAMGLGAIGGGLYSAGRGVAKQKHLILVAVLFGVSLLLTAVTPDLPVALLILILVGGLSVLFISLGNTTLQLTSAPGMRGRIMALWAIAFAGTTPIGGPIIGTIADHSNPRIGLLIGGVSAVIAAALGLLAFGKTIIPDSP
ncbi:MAG TPA: MFS transporter [Ktedonobacteraceae bacterium]|nr:MFS transporter [Ktedonobacteraceae bacterium]